MTDTLHRSPLADRHDAAGARSVPFAGWSMPIQFAGTLVEHEAVRSHAGIFDVSHLGTVHVRGTGAATAVAASFTNDPSKLSDGTSQYTLCCDDSGGIVDDLIVYRLAEDRWVAVPNAANTAAVVDVLRHAAREHGAEVVDASRERAVLAVQGPGALGLVDDVLTSLGSAARASSVDHLAVADIEVAGEHGLLCRTGYTGEPGCELVLPPTAAGAVWDACVDAGARPCGLGARDTLRLEMGYPLHGNDLSTDVTPYEARLGWAVKLDRAPFRGQAALRAAKEAGPRRRLWGLLADGRRPARAGMHVLADDHPVGAVTSGTFSPTLGRAIALALLDDPVGPGDGVVVDVRGDPVDFEVVRPPFVDRDPKG